MRSSPSSTSTARLLRAKELELKAKEYEDTLLVEESKIMMVDLSALDQARRAWFEIKQAMIYARDA
jgi:hypothetical protein